MSSSKNQGGLVPPKSPRNKTATDISDMVVTQHLPPSHEHNRRQKTSTDVISKVGNATILHEDDLKLAEQVATYGTTKERGDALVPNQEQFEEPEDFKFNSEGLTSSEAANRLASYGRNELPEYTEPKWKVFLRQFWSPMPIMIWVAIVIELAIGNYLDMFILLVIQFSNAFISYYETTKAGDAIAALRSSLKPTATCKRDGRFQVIDAALLVPGDTVLLGSGSAIPADCRVNDSSIDVDQAALTGESLPVTFYKGDSCKMGSTVVRGEVEVRVTMNSKLLLYPHREAYLQQKFLPLLYLCLLGGHRPLSSLQVHTHFLERRPVCFRTHTNAVTFNNS